MNLALGALILLTILFPGIVFRLFLIKSESFENTLDTSKTAEVAYIIIPAFFFNFIGVIFIEHLFQYKVAYEELYNIILGKDSKLLHFESIIIPSIPKFLTYISSLTIIGAIFGHFIKKIVLFFCLDLKYSIFSISNEWDTLLSGRLYKHERKSIFFKDLFKYFFLFFSKKLSRKRLGAYIYLYFHQYNKINFDFIQIDLLIKVSNTEMLYTGELKKYYLGKNNTIDKIYITYPERKVYSNTNSNTNDFDSITSDTLVLKGENIVNINLLFIKIPKSYFAQHNV